MSKLTFTVEVDGPAGSVTALLNFLQRTVNNVTTISRVSSSYTISHGSEDQDDIVMDGEPDTEQPAPSLGKKRPTQAPELLGALADRPFGTKIANRLSQGYGFTYLSQLTQFTYDELLAARGIGPKAINVVKNAVERMGLHLLDTDVPFRERDISLIPLRALRLSKLFPSDLCSRSISIPTFGSMSIADYIALGDTELLSHLAQMAANAETITHLEPIIRAEIWQLRQKLNPADTPS